MRNSSIFLSLIVLLAAGAANAADLAQSTLANAYNRVSPALGLIRFSAEITNSGSGDVSRRDSNALGLVVSPSGLVMTHGHMKIENVEPFNVTITLGRGDNEKRYDAEVLAKPDDVNIVFLQIQSDEPLALPYVKFSTANNLGVGASVAMVGVLSDALDHVPGLIDGRVGAVLTEPRTTYCLGDGVRFGYVGAPVIDDRGRVVGVVGFDLTSAEGGDLYVRSGHPLVYQADLFQKYINSPPKEEAVLEEGDEAWLGVFTQPLTEDFAAYWDLDRSGGLIISTVVPGSPAADAGLQTGDIITNFAGTPIRAKVDRDVLGFTKLVRETGAGAETVVKILREGEAVELNITLGTRPRSARDAQEFEDETLGVTVREITTDVRIALNLAEDVQGVIVRRVKSGSVAQVAKMSPGVIIMAIGDTRITSLADYQAAVDTLRDLRPAEVPVFARVGAATGFFRLAPRWETLTE